MSRETPPADDEFELSVIGPGRGECIVVHLGKNNWCVVDSCVASGSTISAAAEYLSAFGNEAVEGVRLVVATHWHDDHIRGLSSALRSFSNATFCCSIALQPTQFIELVELTVDSVQHDSGLEEFKNIYSTLVNRAKQKRNKILIAPRYAIANRLLLTLPRESDGEVISITALSPSDGTFQKSLEWIRDLMPQAGQIQQRIPNVSPNTTSIVLWIKAGRQNVLLGADLEHSTQSSEGWFAVLTAHNQIGHAGMFKVPHHGSSNADCPEVWNEMLEENPIAIVTPFSPSGLPRDLDMQRMLRRTSNLYCTSVGRRKPPRREAAVEKQLRNIERFAIDERLGHVRVRTPLVAEGPALLELFNGAFKVLP
jgi:beta-lactamase superfamily II metal-dependent hydrolase